MKRTITILFLLAMVPIAAVAEFKSPDRFVGLHLVRSNLIIPTTGLGGARLASEGWGLAFSWGKKMKNEFFIKEFDGEFREVSVENSSEIDSLWNLVGFGGVRAQIDIPGRDLHEDLAGTTFRPYVGLGLGLSLWMNDISYRTTSYMGGNRTETTDHVRSATKLNLAYQIKFGLAMPVNEKLDADFNVRYQSLGRPGNSGNAFDLAGNIRNVEFRIGATYKY